MAGSTSVPWTQPTSASRGAYFGQLSGHATAPPARGRAGRTAPPRPRRRCGSGSSCTPRASAPHTFMHQATPSRPRLRSSRPDDGTLSPVARRGRVDPRRTAHQAASCRTPRWSPRAPSTRTRSSSSSPPRRDRCARGASRSRPTDLRAPRAEGTLLTARRDGRIVGVGAWVAARRLPLSRVRPRSPRCSARCARCTGSRARSLKGLRYLTAIEKAHPKEELWYLQLLACDPEHQRSGVGAALLEGTLARATPTASPRTSRPRTRTTSRTTRGSASSVVDAPDPCARRAAAVGAAPRAARERARPDGAHRPRSWRARCAGVALDQAVGGRRPRVRRRPVLLVPVPQAPSQRHRSVGRLHRAVHVRTSRSIARHPHGAARRQGRRCRAVGPAGPVALPADGPAPPALRRDARVPPRRRLARARAGRILRVVEQAHPKSRSGTCSCSWSTPTSSARGSAGAAVTDARGLRPRGAPRVARDPEGGEPRVLREVRLRRSSTSTTPSPTARRCGRCGASPKALAISRPSPPSAARSAGSTRRRTPSAACG